jgi:hypothetical protein
MVHKKSKHVFVFVPADGIGVGQFGWFDGGNAQQPVQRAAHSQQSMSNRALRGRISPNADHEVALSRRRRQAAARHSRQDVGLPTPSAGSALGGPQWDNRPHVHDSLDIPIYGTKEARTAVIVRCARDASHLAARETFANVGGCPYCLRTPDERIAALEAIRRAQRDDR